MKTTNHSSVSASVLSPLLDFILRRSPISTMARLEVMPQADGKSTGGYAWQYHPDKTDPLEPSLIRIWVSGGGRCFWPHADQHVPELPPFWIRTWEEELLIVLAHECRHIAQFWEHPDWLHDRHFLEIDAERFAIKAVQDWRGATVQRRSA